MMLPPKVRVACDGMFTRVLGLTGETIEATDLRFEHDAPNPPKVIISLLAVPFDADGIVAEYWLYDPVSQKKKAVQSICFADGEIWYAPPQQ